MPGARYGVEDVNSYPDSIGFRGDLFDGGLLEAQLPHSILFTVRRSALNRSFARMTAEVSYGTLTDIELLPVK